MLNIGWKYTTRSPREGLLYVEIVSADLNAGNWIGIAHYTGRTYSSYWLGDGSHWLDSNWDLVAVCEESSSHVCSLGCDIVDSGMKWSFCRQCEAQFEFKNWQWQAMKRAT